MADLTVSTDDLALFMGGATLDDDRAQFMLDLAVEACTAFLDPLPDTARAVVYAVAANAYSTPVAGPPEGIGPYTVGVRPAGITLTRRQIQSLQRLTGRSGAFNFDLLPVDYPDSRFPDDEEEE